MVNINIYKKDGTTLLQAPITDDALRSRTLMGENYIDLSWLSPNAINIPAGSYILYQGERFQIYSEYNAAIDDELYLCEPRFHAIEEFFKNIILFREVTVEAETWKEREFNINCNLADALGIVVNALNKSGLVWVNNIVANPDTPTSELKALTFEAISCYDALTYLADIFEYDWWVDFQDGTYQLNIDKSVKLKQTSTDLEGDEVTSDIPAKYTLSTDLDGGLITADPTVEVILPQFIYAFGSDRNIVQDQATENAMDTSFIYRLKLPERFADSKKEITNITTGIEAVQIFEDVYPSYTFKIAEISIETKTLESGVVDIYKMTVEFYNFDIELMPGLPASVHFLSGQLNGFDFEVKIYNGNNSFEIIPADSSGMMLPGESLIPAVGDEFVLYNIIMPDSFVDAARENLALKVDDYIEELKSTVRTIACESDANYFTDNAVVLEVTDLISANGTRAGVQSYEYPLNEQGSVAFNIATEKYRAKKSVYTTPAPEVVYPASYNIRTDLDSVRINALDEVLPKSTLIINGKIIYGSGIFGSSADSTFQGATEKTCYSPEFRIVVSSLKYDTSWNDPDRAADIQTDFNTEGVATISLLAENANVPRYRSNFYIRLITGGEVVAEKEIITVIDGVGGAAKTFEVNITPAFPVTYKSGLPFEGVTEQVGVKSFIRNAQGALEQITSGDYEYYVYEQDGAGTAHKIYPINSTEIPLNGSSVYQIDLRGIDGGDTYYSLNVDYISQPQGAFLILLSPDRIAVNNSDEIITSEILLKGLWGSDESGYKLSILNNDSYKLIAIYISENGSSSSKEITNSLNTSIPTTFENGKLASVNLYRFLELYYVFEIGTVKQGLTGGIYKPNIAVQSDGSVIQSFEYNESPDGAIPPITIVKKMTVNSNNQLVYGTEVLSESLKGDNGATGSAGSTFRPIASDTGELTFEVSSDTSPVETTFASTSLLNNEINKIEVGGSQMLNGTDFKTNLGAWESIPEVKNIEYLDYIEFKGDGAYLNTNILPSDLDDIEIKFSWEKEDIHTVQGLISSRYMINTPSSEGANSVYFSTSTLTWEYGKTGNIWKSTPLLDHYNESVLEITKANVKLDGVVKMTNGLSLGNIPNPYFIGAMYQGTSADAYLFMKNGKVFYANFKNHNLNFVAARVNGVVGLYCAENGILLSNAGAGEILAGNVVSSSVYVTPKYNEQLQQYVDLKQGETYTLSGKLKSEEGESVLLLADGTSLHEFTPPAYNEFVDFKTSFIFDRANSNILFELIGEAGNCSFLGGTLKLEKGEKSSAWGYSADDIGVNDSTNYELASRGGVIVGSMQEDGQACGIITFEETCIDLLINSTSSALCKELRFSVNDNLEKKISIYFRGGETLVTTPPATYTLTPPVPTDEYSVSANATSVEIVRHGGMIEMSCILIPNNFKGTNISVGHNKDYILIVEFGEPMAPYNP